MRIDKSLLMGDPFPDPFRAMIKNLKEFCLNWRHHLGEILISIGAFFLFGKFVFSDPFPVFFGFKIGSGILAVIILLGIFLLATRRREGGKN